MSSPECVIEVGELIRLQGVGGERSVLGPGLSTLRWYRQTFCGIAGAADEVGVDEARVARVPDGSNGVLFLPAREGGLFFGMTYQTDQDECTRAVYEGLVHTAVAVLHKRPGLPRSIRLAGPLAGNVLWSELFARATGIPTTDDDGTHVPEPVSVRVHAALHALHLQCTAAVRGLEVSA